MTETSKKVYTECRSCHMNCPVWVTVENGRVEGIEAVKDPSDPLFNPLGDRLCLRGLAGKQFVYSPTRVRYPLKRAGKRGEGKWERISWDQAVQEIAAKIHEMNLKYGPETFVLPGRTGRQDMGWIAHKIARTIGTPNNYYGAIQVCYMPRAHEAVTFGGYLKNNFGFNPQSKIVLSIGGEMSYSWPNLQRIKTFMNDKNNIIDICLDPTCGPHARKATEWLPIRPGTDLAYLMFVINYLIKHDYYDADFMREWTNAPFLVRDDTGNLLTESDLVAGGSEKRYMFWDEGSDSLKWWDAENVQWEGGVSGKAHYDACVERFYQDKTSTELSPAVMPEGMKPALFGKHSVKLARHGEIPCTPAFELLAKNVEEWTAEKTSEVTWLPVDQLNRTAELLGTVRPVDICQGPQYMATNLSQFTNAQAILKMLCGSVEVAGGHPLQQFYPVEPMPFPGEFDISYADGLDLRQKRKRLGYYEHRIGCGYVFDEEWVKWHPLRPENADGVLQFPDIGCVLDAAETGRPYPVHGIIAVSSNWLVHDPSTARWMKLLEDEEKIQLHVVTELVMTPTAEMADYVLPSVTWLERNYLEFGVGGGDPYKNFYGQAVDPICDAKHDYDFGAMLAHELEKYDPAYNYGLLNPETSKFWAGEYGTLWENDTIDEERDRWCRKYFKKTFEQCLEERRVWPPEYEIAPTTGRHLIAGKFPTDTGKCNMYSTMHHFAGYPALPVYTEPAESPYSRPDLAADYPLVLTTGKRQAGFFHSEFRQLPWMREVNPTPEVFVNSKTAAEFGVKHGDWIWVEAPPTDGREGMHRIMGKLSTRLTTVPGVVNYSQHAWWRPEKTVEEDLHGAFEWNAEVLLQCKDRAPETGTPGLRSQLCKIYKCSEEDVERYRPEITRAQLEALMPMNEEEIR